MGDLFCNEEKSQYKNHNTYNIKQNINNNIHISKVNNNFNYPINDNNFLIIIIIEIIVAVHHVVNLQEKILKVQEVIMNLLFV